ncbi:hypothetical protein [Methanothermobacter defluvii]|nr:hypothetical protein [Methanothermobacter defluvii]
MSTLNKLQRQIFEKLFNMKTGYVLDFSNKAFRDFVRTSVGKDIFDESYEKACDELGYPSHSKANRLRCFWDIESDVTVHKLLKDLLDYYEYLYDDDNEKDWKLFEKAKFILDESLETGSNSEEFFLQQEFDVPDFFSLGLDENIVTILNSRMNEISICLNSEAYLASIFLIGSTLEGILLGIASQYPAEYGRANSSPREKSGKVKKFDKWKLNDLINVSYEIGFLKKDVKVFSHYLRDFRNYIHPYKQLEDKFYPNKHTALLCEQVLKAAMYELSRIGNFIRNEPKFFKTLQK